MSSRRMTFRHHVDQEPPQASKPQPCPGPFPVLNRIFSSRPLVVFLMAVGWQMSLAAPIPAVAATPMTTTPAPAAPQKYNAKMAQNLAAMQNFIGTSHWPSPTIDDDDFPTTDAEETWEPSQDSKSTWVLAPTLPREDLPLSRPFRTTTRNSPFQFNHDYADPQHPYCHRKIQVHSNGISFTFTGTLLVDGTHALESCRSSTPGADDEVSVVAPVLRKDSFEGRIWREDATGRYGVSTPEDEYWGIWEPAQSSGNRDDNDEDPFLQVNGIRWNNGNKWIVQSQAALIPNPENGSYQVIPKPVMVTAQQDVFYGYVGLVTVAAVALYQTLRDKVARTMT